MSDHPQFIDPLVPSFWRYDGDAFEWAVVGATIAVREELIATVTFLDHYGCPPLDDILLFLGAFSRKADILAPYAREVFDHDALEQFVEQDWEPRLQARIEELRSLAQTPPDFPQWKPFLASQTLCQAATPGRFREVLALGSLLPEAPSTPRKQKTLAFRRFVAAVRKLIAPDFLIDKERIEHLWHTSVDRPPEPPPIELPTIAQDENPSLFDLVRQDSEPAALAIGIAEALWPAFSLKSRVQRPQDLPLGGFSDLTNKGSLDRLLPTELAFDDTILAARIVSGEALYSRREAPPLAERHRRIILTDCGIRMWGIRRIIATGVAIALSRPGTDDLDSEIFSNAIDTEFLPSDFSSAEGILKHLSSLSPEALPSKLLEHALHNLPDGPLELFLLTTEATLDDPDFTNALISAAGQHPIQLLEISPKGNLKISLQSIYGRKPLRELSIDLGQIDQSAGRPSQNHESGSLPAFRNITPLPLRILTKPDLRKSAICNDDSIISVSRQRDLLHWDSPSAGALSLSANAPSGTLLAAGVLDDCCSTLSVHATNEQTVLFHCTPGRDGRTTHLPPLPSKPKAALILGSITILIFDRILIAFDEAGRELHRLEMSTPSLIHGSSLRIGSRTIDLSFTTKIVATPVPLDFENPLFQWSSRGAICTAYVKGNETHITVDNGSDQDILVTPGICKIEKLSPFGDAVLLKNPNGNSVARILDSKQTITSRPMAWIERFAPHLSALDTLPATIKNFRSLLILTDRSLGLLTRKNALFTITADDRRLIMRHDQDFPIISPQESPEHVRHQFSEEGVHQDLPRVSFPKTVEIWLDARGFLHFIPAESDLDEFTLSLNTGPMPGWITSHGAFTRADKNEASVAACETFRTLLQNLSAL